MSNLSVAVLIVAALAAVGNFADGSIGPAGCAGGNSWIKICR